MGSNEALDLLVRAFLDGDADMRETAAEAMGTCGDGPFLKVLHELQEKASRDSKAPLQAARSVILNRMGPVEKGWLSVQNAAQESGALSLADAPQAGALSSIPRDDEN